MVLAVAGTATAGIPDPTNSTVDLGPDGGMCSCPDGDGPVYEYITVKARRADNSPIAGIPYNSFFFTITNGDVTISHVDDETDEFGEIRFDMVADETINAGPHTVPPTDPLMVEVQIYTVVLTTHGTLWVNTYDYDGDNDVDPVDFGQFAGDFGGTAQRSDFDWDGDVDPVDFGSFASHFGH
jgi:hypothetical protein